LLGGIKRLFCAKKQLSSDDSSIYCDFTLTLSEIHRNGRVLTFHKPLVFKSKKVYGDTEDNWYLILENDDIPMTEPVVSEENSLLEIVRDLFVFWDAYAKEDDSLLTKQAILFKNRLLNIADERVED